MLIAVLALVGALAFHLTRSGYMEAHRNFPESGQLAGRQSQPSDRLIIPWSAGPELEWQLHHAHVPYAR